MKGRPSVFLNQQRRDDALETTVTPASGLIRTLKLEIPYFQSRVLNSIYF